MIGSAAPALALQICRDSGPCSFDAADDREGDDRFRRISRIAVRPGEGPLSDHTADVQPERRQPLLMPHIGLPLGAGQDRSGAVNGSAAYCENVNQNCPSPIGRDMRRY